MSQVRVKDGKRTVSFYTALSSEEVELAVQQYAGMKTFKKRSSSTQADESDFVPSAPRGQDGVDEMLADFQREFSVEEQKQEEKKPGRGRKRLEPVSLREYDRFNYRLK